MCYNLTHVEMRDCLFKDLKLLEKGEKTILYLSNGNLI